MDKKQRMDALQKIACTTEDQGLIKALLRQGDILDDAVVEALLRSVGAEMVVRWLKAIHYPPQKKEDPYYILFSHPDGEECGPALLLALWEKGDEFPSVADFQHLERLLEVGFVRIQDGRYVITEDGRRLCEDIERVAGGKRQ